MGLFACLPRFRTLDGVNQIWLFLFNPTRADFQLIPLVTHLRTEVERPVFISWAS